MKMQKISNLKNNYHQKNPIYLQKNTNMSMDIFPEKVENESIYLNKILKNSLDGKTVKTKFPNLKNNIPNIHSSIRNILSNEESREKAMKYFINRRNKRVQQSVSPFESRYTYSSNLRNNNTNKNKNSNDNNNVRNNNVYYKTKDEDLYDNSQRNKRIIGYSSIKEFNNDENNYKKNMYSGNDLSPNNKNINVRSYKGYNIYTNRMNPIFQNKEAIIRVNKINKNDNDFEENLMDENEFMQRRLNRYRNSSDNNENDEYFYNNNYSTYRNTTNYKQVNRKLFYSTIDNYKSVNLNNNKLKQVNNRDESGEKNITYNDLMEDTTDDLIIDNIPLKESSLSENNEVIQDDIKNVYQSPQQDNYYKYTKTKFIEPIYSKYGNNKVYNKYNKNNFGLYKNNIGEGYIQGNKNKNKRYSNLKIEKNIVEIKPKFNRIIKKPKVTYNFDLMKKNKTQYNKKNKTINVSNETNIDGEENKINDFSNLNHKLNIEINNLKNELKLLKEKQEKERKELKNKELEQINKFNSEINKLKNENKILNEEKNK